MQLFRNLGGTIGIAVMGTVLSSALKHNLTDLSKSGEGADMSKLDPATAEKFAQFANPQMLTDQPALKATREGLTADLQVQFDKMIDLLRDALSNSLSTVFMTGAAILFIAVVLVWFIREIPLRTSNKAPQDTSGAVEVNVEGQVAVSQSK